MQQPKVAVTLNVPPKFGETIIPTVKKTTPFKLDTTPQVQQPKVAPVSIYDDNAISMGDFQKLQQQQFQQRTNEAIIIMVLQKEKTLNAIQNTDRNLLDDIKDAGNFIGTNIAKGIVGIPESLANADKITRQYLENPKNTITGVSIPQIIDKVTGGGYTKGKEIRQPLEEKLQTSLSNKQQELNKRVNNENYQMPIKMIGEAISSAPKMALNFIPGVGQALLVLLLWVIIQKKQK